MRLSFQVCVHGRPETVRPGSTCALAGLELAAAAVTPAGLPPLGTTFEAACEALSQLARLYCEPDGSFVWVGSENGTRWQIDGNLYDRAGRLLYVELKGCCPASACDQLLTAFGWPATRLLFQLTREAVYLEEPEFRRYAAAIAQGDSTT